ncbi:hypothetical protein NQZ68_003490 [Dissostichus eleginoides]|nr:hypothetical protein NQZ68_003490 [Dissostichus eleginoides]
MDACKQGREELVAFFMLLSLLELYSNCCWREKYRKNNFPSVVCLPLYCSKTSPSRPWYTERGLIILKTVLKPVPGVWCRSQRYIC